MRTVTVRDVDGNDLATACLRPESDGPRLTLDRVLAGKGRLLHHYFGKGLRAVMLDTAEFRLRGTLSTQWLGAERRWFVDLQPVMIPIREDVRRPWERPGA